MKITLQAHSELVDLIFLKNRENVSKSLNIYFSNTFNSFSAYPEISRDIAFILNNSSISAYRAAGGKRTQIPIVHCEKSGNEVIAARPHTNANYFL